MVKQVIVMRKDLNMRKGKMVAQGAHASMKVFFDRMVELPQYRYIGDIKMNGKARVLPMPTDEMLEWITGSFTKVCVSVDSESELNDIYQKALDGNIPCAMITDSGLTEFGGIPTKTCIAIGPANSEQIDVITGHLKLL